MSGGAAHRNMVKAQEAWDAAERGELGGVDDFADAIVVENGPGAGPWRVVEREVALFTFVLQFMPFFEGAWHQDGTCISADDRCTVSMVEQTGTGPEGDEFDNMARFDRAASTTKEESTGCRRSTSTKSALPPSGSGTRLL
jgi:hypothetical protein